MFSLEVESYYKTVANRIDYIDGSELIGNNTIETEILNGQLRAYGMEYLLRKNQGDFTGWLAYTISKAEQRTPGGSAGGPGINNGNWYRATHDRTHDISFTGAYKLNKKWSAGVNFVFQTGRPATYPIGWFEHQGLPVISYSDRNTYRMPAYHRLDVSATYQRNKNPQKKWKSEWVFGIYNLYNRHNAASVYFRQSRDTDTHKAFKTYIFGIIPSVTYNFKF